MLYQDPTKLSNDALVSDAGNWRNTHQLRIEHALWASAPWAITSAKDKTDFLTRGSINLLQQTAWLL